MIWSGEFHSYGDEDSWPVINGPKIIPDRSLVNRGRRRVIRYKNAMDKMEAKKKKKNKENEASTSAQPQEPPPPYPMEVLQSGRRTSRPPPRNRRSTVQRGRLSMSADPRNPTNRDEMNIQPRRNSISVDPRSISHGSVGIRAESTRFPSGEGIGEGSSRVSGRGIGAKLRGFLARKKK